LINSNDYGEDSQSAKQCYRKEIETIEVSVLVAQPKTQGQRSEYKWEYRTISISPAMQDRVLGGIGPASLGQQFITYYVSLFF